MPPTENNMTVDSMADALAEGTRLEQLNQGWMALRIHDMTQASLGVMAVRRIGADGIPLHKMPKEAPQPGEHDEEVSFEWLPYGKPQVPHITIATTPQEFKQLVDAMRPRGIFPCNDADDRMIGFVSYDGETAHIVRYPSYKVKDGTLDPNLHREIQIHAAQDIPWE